MEIELTIAQIEAIQKLLSAHAEIGGEIPSAEVCFRAFLKIREQTGISKITDKDLKQIKQAKEVLENRGFEK